MYATTSLEGIIVVHRNVIWNNNFDSNSTEIINARSSELFWWTIKAIDSRKKWRSDIQRPLLPLMISKANRFLVDYRPRIKFTHIVAVYTI